MSSVDDGTIMDVLRESEKTRLTTTAIADQLPLARGTVRTRLQRLADDGRLDRERDGRHVVWYLPDRSDEKDEEGDDDEERAKGERTADATDATGGATVDVEPSAREPPADRVTTVEPAAGSFSRAAVAVAALLAVYLLIRRLRERS